MKVNGTVVHAPVGPGGQRVVVQLATPGDQVEFFTRKPEFERGDRVTINVKAAR